MTEEDANRVLAQIRHHAQIVTPTSTVQLCRDADDNAVIDCALAGTAHFFVTADSDLLVIKAHRGIRILSVRDFLAAIGELEVSAEAALQIGNAASSALVV